MVGIGAGLASCGYVPILTSLGSFLWYNAYDQARLSVALAGLNVKFLGSHSGFSTGREGPSSMGTEDIVLASALPPMTVLVPCDPVSMRKLVVAACAHVGPVYIRSSREPLPRVYAEDAQFAIGRANVVRQGSDVTLIGCGLMVPVALDAAAILAEEGIQARVLDMHTVKPLDVAAITAAARRPAPSSPARSRCAPAASAVTSPASSPRRAPCRCACSPSPTSSRTPRRPPRSCRTAG